MFAITDAQCYVILSNTNLSPLAQFHQELECGPMPNVMAALLNIDGAFCSTPPSLADAHYYSAVQ